MMHNLPAILSGQQGGAPFNPETDITWHSLFWAEGTDFVAQGYSDTDAVGTWPNETGESDATQATEANKPTYDAVHASFNNQPVVDFDGTNDYLQTANFTSGPSYTSGISVVVIGNIDATGSPAKIFVDGNDSTNRNVLFSQAGTTWAIAALTLQEGGTQDTSSHLFVCQFDGSTGNDILDIDGSNVITADAGSVTLDGLTIGTQHGLLAWLDGKIAFLGIYEGDITADGSWSDFETWVSDHYGITIA